MRYYFKLQYLRFNRDLKAIGIDPIAGICIFFVSFFLVSQLIFVKVDSSVRAQLYLAINLLIVSTLGGKNRNHILKTIFPPINFLQIRLIENLLAALPVSIFLVFKNHYLMAVGNIVLCCLLSRCNKIGLPSFQIPSPFSKYPYEFTIGFRRGLIFIAAIHVMAIISFYLNNLNLGLISLLNLFLMSMTFYSERDPVYFVWIYSQTARAFLMSKIKIGLLYSFCLSVVILLPLIILNVFSIGKIILTLVVGSLYIVHAILAAYVNFPAKKTMSQKFQFYSGIVVPPLLLFIIPNMYYQAVQRLKDYLHC